MPRKGERENCDVTGQLIFCIRCLKPRNFFHSKKHPHGKHLIVCDYHKALIEYRRIDKIDDSHVFDLPVFIQKIDWNKVDTTCQPELTILFKNIKRTNDDLARRVV